MTREFVVLAGSLALAGCSGFALPSSMPTLPLGSGGGIAVRLDSNPPGADARTSLGPACRTPCSVAVAATEGFTVTFALPGFETQTIQVSALRSGGLGSEPAGIEITPNPVFAELAPAAPGPVATKKPNRAKSRAAAKPVARTAPAPASAAPTSGAAQTTPANRSSPAPRMIPGSQPTAPASAWPPPR